MLSKKNCEHTQHTHAIRRHISLQNSFQNRFKCFVCMKKVFLSTNANFKHTRKGWKKNFETSFLMNASRVCREREEKIKSFEHSFVPHCARLFIHYDDAVLVAYLKIHPLPRKYIFSRFAFVLRGDKVL
jgi:hypothetical protein